MSHKNRNNHTVAADVTSNDRILRAVPENPDPQPASSTEDKVRSALADNPGSTTAALAIAAGVGRSTAAKILARWGRDGTTIRTTGDGPRNPDTWTLTPSESATTAEDTADTPTDATAPSNADHASALDDEATIAATDAAGTQAETSSSPSTESTAAKGIPAEASSAEDQATDEKVRGAGSAASDKVGAGVDVTSPSPRSTPVASVPDTTATASSPSAETARAGTESAVSCPTDKDRLPKGGLRALVEEYLTEHPGEGFGPAQIGKELGRSGGAVNNALERLVVDGYAIKTCEAPKRFAINPDKTDVTPTPDAV